MMRKLSVRVEKEISGYGFYSSDGNYAGLAVEPYRKNSWMGGHSTILKQDQYYSFSKLGRVTPAFHFHTHPGLMTKFGGRIGSDPYPSNDNSVLPPGAKPGGDQEHLRATGYLPHIIFGGSNNGTVLMTGNGNGGYNTKVFK